jgi:hypothetical protein
MAYGNWDDIIVWYQELMHSPRYEELAKAMLSLIPRLREHAAFAGLIPSTSHEALCLTIPTSKKIVYIGGNEVFIPYAISLYELENNKFISESFADKNTVIQTIEHYVEQLRRVS